MSKNCYYFFGLLFPIFAHTLYSQNHFRFEAIIIPSPSKQLTGGEDTYYSDKNTLAVADGVGGWAKYGIDSGKYSKELCNNLRKYRENDFLDYFDSNPKSLLKKAAQSTTSKGSSTLILVTLNKKKPILNSANIGDCRYVLLERTKEGTSYNLKYISETQQKGFNYPYQLGINADNPDLAVTMSHIINNGDLIIVGSDGLFDNMDEKAILTFINENDFFKNGRLNLSELIEKLSKRAYELSLDRDHESPFEISARKMRKLYKGGKSDDITIIVAEIFCGSCLEY